MYLYLIRHGDAVPADVDPERPLSDEGLEAVDTLAEALRAWEVVPAEIWHSPKLRARQTAQRIAQHLDVDPREHHGLSPNDDPEDVALELEHAEGNVLIVGHLPHLSYLAARLILGTDGPPFANFDPAGGMCLRRESPGLWTLRWFLSPRML